MKYRSTKGFESFDEKKKELKHADHLIDDLNVNFFLLLQCYGLIFKPSLSSKLANNG